ncbi:hypothetical protein K474DRAFT_1637713 [Panus rudis PR-1116 ss-1]|nr:hypothetical protein K474DRAFT_1637713 [Panus rudis PR-1116 ss-1]
MGLGGYTSGGYVSADAGAGEGSKAGEKQVRRRSSKACDQCRKSKCKCERSSPHEPCRNCLMLNTPCTFLGPSRKRGPPKGYIDAIEARLHQTEALIGILLSSKDSRAKTLLQDLSEDSLAKEIINRVNGSPYGHRGRNKGPDTVSSSRTRPANSDGTQSEAPSIQATHPTTEWQEAVIARMNSAALRRNTTLPEQDQVFGEVDLNSIVANTSSAPPEQAPQPMDEDNAAPAREPKSSARPALSLQPPTSTSPAPGPASSGVLLTPHSATAERPHSAADVSARRQRRRMDGDEHTAQSPSNTSASGRSRSPVRYALPPPHPALLSPGSASGGARGVRTSLSPDLQDADGDDESIAAALEGEEGDGEDELAIAVGQLSINEDEQVRYHGKASGLHLLGSNERADGRSENGIWRFPRARVWPPLPPTIRSPTKSEEEWMSRLPDLAEQEHLLNLYFIYVHPALPIIHKQTFWDSYRNVNLREAAVDTPTSQASESSTGRRHQRIPTILLLAMFSIAARYSSTTSDNIPPPEEGSMWAAGDAYLEDAKAILDSSYAASRPSTVQALLLMGYREVGIGAMAQAWLYIGMAVRMAQDLGMHKNADKWSDVGRVLFTPEQLQERRRIWYGCVVMDKYVSVYIGRPVAIFENDFDTELPSIEESDELEIWAPDPSPPLLDDAMEPPPHQAPPVVGYVISCFNEAAKLSIILSMIIQAIYPIRPHVFRLTEFSRLEKLLNRWYLELPEHLRFDPASQKHTTLPPHALTLHMQYWCTVLLLHRPFIRHLIDPTSKQPSNTNKEVESRLNARKNYDLCVQAANNITAIVSVYVELHCIRRAPVFLCFYIFTAAIMHVSTLKTYPNDPQASIGLHKCMDALHRMQSVWPSAWRAYQLLRGTNLPSLDTRISMSPPAAGDRHKRPAEHALELEYPDDSQVEAAQRQPVPSVQRLSQVPPAHHRMVDEPRVAIAQSHRPQSGDAHMYRQHQQQQQPQSSSQLSRHPQAQSQQQQSQSQSHHQPHSHHPSSQGYPSRPATASHAAASNFPLGIDLPSAESPAFFQSFDRWPSENNMNNFPGTLSTSVLPQQYSTGMIDERSHRGGQERPSSTQRFPQYWSDYSALNQMEASSYAPLVGDMVVQPQHQNPSSSRHTQSPAYAQDQYSVYNNLPPGSQ